ncbi:unnamed protein product [Closterium sp. NIES-54]
MQGIINTPTDSKYALNGTPPDITRQIWPVGLGGYGRTDPLLNKPFYANGLVVGILTWYQSGLGFESRCMHMQAVADVLSPGPPSVGGCQKTCTVRSPIDPWRVTGLLAWGVMGALTRYLTSPFIPMV